MSGRHYPIAGKRLWVEDDGKGEPVVLLHGLSLDGRMWEPQLPALATKFRVIRPDLCGFGQSEDPTEHEKYSDCDHLNELLTQMRIDYAHVVSLSRGGRTALKFTLGNLNRVRSLVIMDCALRLEGARVSGHDEIKETTVRLMKDGKWAEARAKWDESHLWRRMCNGELDPLLKRMLDDCFANKHRWYLADPNVGLKADDFKKINAPVLVMYGVDETDDIKKDADTLKNEITHLEPTRVPNAGHMANIDNPNFVNSQLVSFLTRTCL